MNSYFCFICVYSDVAVGFSVWSESGDVQSNGCGPVPAGSQFSRF